MPRRGIRLPDWLWQSLSDALSGRNAAIHVYGAASGFQSARAVPYANGAVGGAAPGAPGSGEERASFPGSSGQPYRVLELEPGLVPTGAQRDQIDSINSGLAHHGSAVYASGDEEAIRDYENARLIYAPSYMARKNAEARDGVADAAARAAGNTIWFGDAAYWAYRRTYPDTYFNATRLQMSGAASRAWTIAHEFGHIHRDHLPVPGSRELTENRANDFARKMTPYIRSQNNLSVRVIYGP